MRAARSFFSDRDSAISLYQTAREEVYAAKVDVYVLIEAIASTKDDANSYHISALSLFKTNQEEVLGNTNIYSCIISFFWFLKKEKLAEGIKLYVCLWWPDYFSILPDRKKFYRMSLLLVSIARESRFCLLRATNL